jgi:hypothetical protein
MTRKIFIPLVVAVCAALLSSTVYAQRGRRNRPIVTVEDHWLVEGAIAYSLLENDEVLLVKGRAGKQVNESFFLGGSASILLRDAETLYVNGYDRIDNLTYVGPTIEYSNVFRGRVRYYFGLTAAIGTIGYESMLDGVLSDHSGLFAGIEPEIGLLILAGRRRVWQIRTSIGGMAGTLPASDITIYTAPVATFGLRIPL